MRRLVEAVVSGVRWAVAAVFFVVGWASAASAAAPILFGILQMADGKTVVPSLAVVGAQLLVSAFAFDTAFRVRPPPGAGSRRGGEAAAGWSDPAGSFSGGA
jgi:hypothetical protein